MNLTFPVQTADMVGAARRSAAPLAIVDHVDVTDWGNLCAQSRRKWEDIRVGHSDYRSPFFSTAFCDAVHAVRGDVSVAILRSGGQAVGFLPVHRIGRVAVPAGRCFNDAHGVLLQPGAKFDWLWLLDRCDWKAYDFHALVGEPSAHTQRFSQGTTESFSAEIGDDSQTFLERLQRDHKTIRRQSQKSRKMQREVGPLSLEIDCRDPEILRQTIRWKRQQYRRTNILDLFTPEWTRALVENLHQNIDRRTRGILSVLRAGDEVVAAHYGMIEGDLLHYWFPTYNVRFARYSPGTALFIEIIRAASDHRIRCVDMGYGEQPYKRKQTDTITSVSYGCVTNSRVYRHWKHASQAATGALKNVPMKEQLKQLLRTIQPNAGISKLS